MAILWQLATDTPNFADGDVGMVEITLSYLNDRLKKNYSKSEIVAYLNLEQRKLANAINLFYETYFLQDARTTSVAGQTRYSLPADAVQLWNIEIADSPTDLDPKKLVEIDLEDKYFYNRLQEVNRKRDFGLYWIAGNNFNLTPHDADGGKTIRVFYVKRLVDMVENTDTSDIPEEHQELLPLGAARRGRAKFGRPNPELERLYTEGMGALEAGIAKFRPRWEETVTPFYGTYGPNRTVNREIL